MAPNITRGQLMQTAGAVSLTSLLPRAIFSQGTGNKQVVVHAEKRSGWSGRRSERIAKAQRPVALVLI
jgi:hypothetical protein